MYALHSCLMVQMYSEIESTCQLTPQYMTCDKSVKLQFIQETVSCFQLSVYKIKTSNWCNYSFNSVAANFACTSFKNSKSLYIAVVEMELILSNTLAEITVYNNSLICFTQRRSQNPAKYLKWSFQQKQLTFYT